MADGAPSRSRPVAVALALDDAALCDRLVIILDRDNGLLFADREFADVVVADRAGLGRAERAAVLVGEADADDLSPWVRAILPADAGPRLILAAVELVAAGFEILPDQTALGASEMHETPSRLRDDRDPSVAPNLTPREKQVLQLLAGGASNKLIARRLELSVHTAKFHVASVLRKLGAQSRLEAVGIGVRLGLVLV